MTIYREKSAGGTPSDAKTGTATWKAIGQKNSDEYWNGQLDEVKIYNRALSVPEITKNYNHGKSKHS